MKDHIEERAKEVAVYLIKTKSTTRAVAERFGIGKSTVYKDVAERLPKINPALAEEARKVLDENKEIRSLRGGLSTQRIYRQKRAAEAAK